MSAGFSLYIKDSLVGFGCFAHFGRVVVFLTHSPFPFSFYKSTRKDFFVGLSSIDLSGRIFIFKDLAEKLHSTSSLKQWNTEKGPPCLFIRYKDNRF